MLEGQGRNLKNFNSGVGVWGALSIFSVVTDMHWTGLPDQNTDQIEAKNVGLRGASDNFRTIF